MSLGAIKLSVVCPVLNEEAHIEKLLQFFVESKPYDKELIVLDGGSEDKTKQIVEKWVKKHPNICLIDNLQKYVPFALNKGIKLSQGSHIVRVDAHSDYREDYFEKIIETFQKTGADIVGGPTRTAYNTHFQRAVAKAICTPFAVGNSKVHEINYEGYTDSVTFGAWEKKMFDETGFFDTMLKRNQDDEFHYRAKSLGKTIYQSPEICLWYYPRNTVKGLLIQYFQYGFYKPLVLRKVKSEIKLRHLIPVGFVLYLLLLPYFLRFFGSVFILPLILYLGVLLFYSLRMAKDVKMYFNLLLAYPVIHLGYGTGFFLGIFKKNI